MCNFVCKYLGLKIQQEQNCRKQKTIKITTIETFIGNVFIPYIFFFSKQTGRMGDIEPFHHQRWQLLF